MDQACPTWIASTSQSAMPVRVSCLDCWYLSVDQRDRGEPCLSHVDCQYLSVDHACPVWITSTCQPKGVEPSRSCMDCRYLSINQTDRDEPEYWVIQICLKQHDNGRATCLPIVAPVK